MEMLEVHRLDQISEVPQYGLVNPRRAARMLNRIVLDVTYACTLACPNCNRFCGLFPRQNAITLAKVREFVDASISAAKRWVHIYIAGGEPSLHSELGGILAEVRRYDDFHKARFGGPLIVKYFTNGHSARSKEVLASLPDFIINNSDKKDSFDAFKPICVAPIDLGSYDDDRLRPCSESYDCGMALNFRGYYPCAEAAAIDDVLLKRDLAVTDLADATLERMALILHETCRYCGFYFEPVGCRRSSKLMVSPSWKKVLS